MNKIFIVGILSLTGLVVFPGCNEPPPAEPKVSLIEASVSNDLASVQSYIDNKADLNPTDDQKSTPLMIASTFGHTELAKMLIEAGADIELQNQDGSTALHVAAFMCHKDIVQLLLDAGIDKSKKNNLGSTALQSVEAPYELVKPIYDFIGAALAPTGLVIDHERLKAERPNIAEMFK